MTKLNVSEELYLNGCSLTKVATNYNPYLKNPEKAIATANFVKEYVESSATTKSISSDVSKPTHDVDLCRLFDCLLVYGKKDVVFGLHVDEEYQQSSVISAFPQQFSTGEIGIYLASSIRVNDGCVKKISQTTPVDWNPDLCENLFVGNFSNITINSTNSSKGTLYVKSVENVVLTGLTENITVKTF